MIWLYFLVPIVIIGGITVYFEKKSGMTKPNENKQADNLGEVLKHNRININGPGTGTD
ncbi:MULTISPECIES: hypothetical protein [Bacillaceae]|uniref:hypothetical protein n=1 Tax=Bacillaceae TaxID=186817 RepID=UPI00159B923F|nr:MULTISPECIES: hypothetical protein [Bacillaceae]MCM3164366.1 hypothetical protein [Metabacillus litoralis]